LSALRDNKIRFSKEGKRKRKVEGLETQLEWKMAPARGPDINATQAN